MNFYSVNREGKELNIAITTGRLGFSTVLWRSGLLFLCGFVYFLIGTLVYMMKPGARESWLFFVMTALLGLRICWAAPSDLFYPLWLFDLRNLFSMFFPATLLHLTVVFPKKYAFISKRSWILIVPYVLAVAASSFIYVAVADLIPGLHQRVEFSATLKQVVLIGAGVGLIYVAHSTLHT